MIAHNNPTGMLQILLSFFNKFHKIKLAVSYKRCWCMMASCTVVPM